MSCSEEKLKNVESEISKIPITYMYAYILIKIIIILVESKYDCDVRVIPVDFTDGQSVYEDIQAEISDLDVGILG